MLHSFLPPDAVNQLYAHIPALCLEPPSHLRPPTLQVCTKSRAELPALNICFPLAVTRGGAHVAAALSVHPTLPFPHLVH